MNKRSAEKINSNKDIIMDSKIEYNKILDQVFYNEILDNEILDNEILDNEKKRKKYKNNNLKTGIYKNTRQKMYEVSEENNFYFNEINKLEEELFLLNQKNKEQKEIINFLNETIYKLMTRNLSTNSSNNIERCKIPIYDIKNT